MATLAANSTPVADPEVPAPAAPGARKKWFLILALVLMLGAGLAAWFVLSPKAESKASNGKDELSATAAPVFIVLDAFTVNLQPDGQFLQATFTVQMASQDDSNNIKAYMPQVRSRLLLMLSNKTVAELSTVEGKTKLGAEVTSLIEQPFAPKLKPVKVSNVFITSFVIQ